MFTKTPSRLQAGEMDCASTCLGIMLAHYGQTYSSIKLRQACAVGRDGATVAQVQRGAESLGYRCTIIKKGLHSLSKARDPIIVHWNMNHFVVLEGINNNYVWINDPACGHRKLPVDEFERHFTGICLVIEAKEFPVKQSEGQSFAAMWQLIPVRHSWFGMLFFSGLIAGVFLFLMELLFGAGARTFFDYIIEYDMTSWAAILAFAGLVIIMLRGWVRYLQGIQQYAHHTDVASDMKREFLNRIYAKPVSFFETHFTGELYNRLCDMERLLHFMVHNIREVGVNVVLVIASAGALWLLSPLITLLQLIPNVVFLVWMLLTNKHIQELELKEKDANARYEAVHLQRCHGFERFFAAGIQNHLLSTGLPALSQRQSARFDAARQQTVCVAAKRGMDMLSMPLITFAGAFLLIAGDLSYGGFMLASMLALLLATELNKFVETIIQYKRLVPVMGRVSETLDTIEQELGKITDVVQTTSHVSSSTDTSPVFLVQSVRFGYNGSNNILLDDINLQIHKGEIVNLSGPSGVGKTTFLDLLAGIRCPLKGHIYYKGKCLQNYAPVGYVFADDELVFGSLSEYVSNGKPVDLERLGDVIQITGLTDRLGFFVASDGSECLQDQGLSRGEMQKLQLAQALYYNDACVLFDEAFNHLSLKQSDAILQALRDRGTTVVMATHRPEIQALCDRSFVLHSG